MDAVNRQPILPLELTNVVFRAGGQDLIRKVSFRLEAGPRTLVLGPNGAGKSLLLRLCHGLLKPTSGTIRWHGVKQDKRGGGNAKSGRQHAMVFQRPVMLRRSARANLDYALGLHGFNPAARRQRIGEVLERTGLSHLADRPARVMSIGEQQRLALARAWALDPQVLFLDEPTASLDPAATKAVEDIINSIHEHGTRIVMTTHDLGQARRLADEVMFIHQGRVAEQTPAARFFETPDSEAGRAYLRGELFI